MVTEITAQMTDIEAYLPYIVPMCVMRLGSCYLDIMALCCIFLIKYHSSIQARER